MNRTLNTVKYFDLFDYPLTRDELRKWQFKGGEIDTQGLSELDGFYFLPGRDVIVKTRKEREMISLKKIRKAQKIARIIGMIPNVSLVSIVSNLGYLNAELNADIDLFIVAKPGRIWGVRFWSVMLMKILGQRPTKKNMKDKICLSYYTDENNLNLESTKISEPDPHLCYLVSQNLPIYSESDMWERFVEENKWINKYLPNFKYSEDDKRFMIKLGNPYLKGLIAKTELGFEEKLYRFVQMSKMASELKVAMNKGDKKVIINDEMLKLHTNDKRDEINRKFEGK
jgi:hypothetical protein